MTPGTPSLDAYMPLWDRHWNLWVEPDTFTGRKDNEAAGHLPSPRLDFLHVCLDIIDGILDSGDAFCILIWDLDVKFLFERHDEFHRVQGVSPKIVYERGLRGDFILLDAQLLDDNLLHP